MNRLVRRTLAALTLTAAALLTPAAVHDLTAARSDTAWGAPTLDDTPAADPIATPLDTAWG